jgi:4-amino-4-deoxy-L-arabinose transferase-like glycosyltransferase
MLSRNGMANSYYAAAVRSATVSWKAFFFGSLDPGSFITVDKLPASLWVQAISARIFGFSSWSILIPQALAGVGSVLILHRLVRQWKGEIAALLAALALALTPVAVLLFRFNNPDALLVLLLLGATWALWSALRTGSTWKLVLTGAILGVAFLTKMSEALLIVPALALVYLVCGPKIWWRRLLQLGVALVAFIVSSSWWIAIVELWPETARPYIGGTTTNSILGLIVSRTSGYGITATGSGNLSGAPGWLRMFNTQLGGQVSWLLPLALMALVAGLWVTARQRRTDTHKAGYILWGTWTISMLGVFSFMTGTFHSYYVIVLAPGIAALAGAGAVEMWRLGRENLRLCWLLPACIFASAVWAAVLLTRRSGYAAGLATTVLIAAGIAAIVIMITLAGFVKRRWAAYAAAALAVVALLAGPFAYDLSTISRSVTGNTAAAGPTSSNENISGESAASDVDEGLLAYLEQNRASATYLVAVQGASSSIPIILSTGEPVLTIGGYKMRDPYPSLDDFVELVESGKIRYALLSGSSSSRGASQQAAEVTTEISTWITKNGTAIDAGVYGGDSSDGTLYLLPQTEVPS